MFIPPNHMVFSHQLLILGFNFVEDLAGFFLYKIAGSLSFCLCFCLYFLLSFFCPPSPPVFLFFSLSFDYTLVFLSFFVSFSFIPFFFLNHLITQMVAMLCFMLRAAAAGTLGSCDHIPYYAHAACSMLLHSVYNKQKRRRPNMGWVVCAHAVCCYIPQGRGCGGGLIHFFASPPSGPASVAL
jgi:hypothetical protein